MDDEHLMQELDQEFKPNHEPVDGLMVFTEEDYQELQRNLVLYKEGSQEAITYIVRTFHPFITKYARFIKLGNLPYMHGCTKDGTPYSRVSPTISSFVSLFIENNSKRKLDKQEKRKVFSLTCVKIKSLFAKYEYGEIYNELVLALLNMANKYKITKEGDQYHKKNGTFHMYVSKCFHWEAFRFLSKLIKDPLTHLEVLNLIDQFDDMDDDNNEGKIVASNPRAQIAFEIVLEDVARHEDLQNDLLLTEKEEREYSAYDPRSLNFNWTNGVTCSDLFSDLTPYERELLVLSFIKKKNDIEIGKMYNRHRATINKHKKQAVRKVQEKAKLLNLI